MEGFIITDADAAQARAERDAQTRAMLAEADYADYLADLADEYEGEPSGSPVACTECGGTGVRRFSTGFGLSDWIEELCPWCKRPISDHDDAACPPANLVALALPGKQAA
jgi:hypothetical protein